MSINATAYAKICTESNSVIMFLVYQVKNCHKDRKNQWNDKIKCEKNVKCLAVSGKKPNFVGRKA